VLLLFKKSPDLIWLFEPLSFSHLLFRAKELYIFGCVVDFPRSRSLTHRFFCATNAWVIY
jgi:hypothetical protein